MSRMKRVHVLYLVFVLLNCEQGFARSTLPEPPKQEITTQGHSATRGEIVTPQETGTNEPPIQEPVTQEQMVTREIAVNNDTDTGEVFYDPIGRWRDICSAYNFAVYAVLFGLISLGGTIGNVLCLVTLWPDRNKSATTLFLLQLAVVDTLVLQVWSVMLTIPTAATYKGIWWMDFIMDYAYLQQFGWAVCNIIQMIACWLIVIITVQRYIAVCHPHKMRVINKPSVAWLQLAILVLVSVVFNLPRFFEYKVVIVNGMARRINTEFGSSSSYQVVYKGVIFYVVMFIMPVCILVVLTLLLIRQLKNSAIKVGVAKTVAIAATSKTENVTIETTTAENESSKKKSVQENEVKGNSDPDNVVKDISQNGDKSHDKSASAPASAPDSSAGDGDAPGKAAPDNSAPAVNDIT